MEVKSIARATLTHEDIREAIAEYASKSFGGEFSFNPNQVRIFPEGERDEIEVEATVTDVPSQS